ncbi:lanthionine synthetase LanC family protein [Candidatus Enterococcus ikei]|uniref:Uncharacterized protein n=1 Tax=Candidatus Enterococcus ikei TaxID=2815326 RepID=A0ABS3GV22_9ENTE|nr:lanthionine synthetase LanC family protein [Enterococcus sp. DIV0869a]MBO0439107.1 hypothetical protein [Enterococcus sp. DIV0869a]
MNEIKTEIDRLEKMFEESIFSPKGVENTRFALSLALIFLLEGDKNKASYYFDFCLHHLKHLHIPGIQYGYTELAYIAQMMNKKFGTYQQLTEQLNDLLLGMVTNIQLSKENKFNVLDPLNGVWGIFRYLDNTSMDFKFEYTQFLKDYYSLTEAEPPFIDFVQLSYPGQNQNFRLENYVDLGLAHGLAGHLWTLGNSRISIIEKELLIERISNCLFQHIVTSGDKKYFPGWLLKKDNQLVLPDDAELFFSKQTYKWCYGSLGILTALYPVQLYLSKQNKELVDTVLRSSLNNIADTPLTDHCYCHGTSGQYRMLKVIDEEYQLIGKTKLAALKQDLQHGFEKEQAMLCQESFIQFPESLYSHIDGYASLIITMLQEKEKPEINALVDQLRLIR